MEKLTRRDFHRLALAGMGAAVFGIGKEAVGLMNSIPDVEREYISIILPPAKLPVSLINFGINAPGIKDLHSVALPQALSSASRMGVRAVRELLGNEIEPIRVGEYDTSPLGRVIDLADKLSMQKPQITLELDLFDFFPLLWEKHYAAVNPLSQVPASISQAKQSDESQPLVSPDLCLTPPEKQASAYMRFLDPEKTDEENRRSFLKDPKAQEAVKNRIRFILTTPVEGRTIAGHPNIVYFSINEPPDVPEAIPWGRQMCDFIRALSAKPAGIGVRAVNDSFWAAATDSQILSFHLYAESYPSMIGFYDRAAHSSVPVRLEETGLPLPLVRYQRLQEGESDSIWNQSGHFLQDTILSTYYTMLFNTFIPRWGETYYPSVLSWRAWRLGGFFPECNFDHFNVNPSDLPQTAETFRRISNFLEKAKIQAILN